LENEILTFVPKVRDPNHKGYNFKPDEFDVKCSTKDSEEEIFLA
jgi:hypothetical protein